MVNETNVQLASLQLYAKEVSVAYGIKQKLEGPVRHLRGRQAGSDLRRSLQEYNFLLPISSAICRAAPRAASTCLNAQPSIWPVDGRLMMSGFRQPHRPVLG